jgi:hypothetical protein
VRDTGFATARDAFPSAADSGCHGDRAADERRRLSMAWPLAEAGQHTARPRRGVVNCSDLQANPSTEVQQGRVCLVYGNEFELAKKQLACDPSEGIEFPQTHPRLLFSVLK